MQLLPPSTGFLNAGVNDGVETQSGNETHQSRIHTPRSSRGLGTP
jgi:hypothetical protein